MIGMKREGERGGKKVGRTKVKKRAQENLVMVGGAGGRDRCLRKPMTLEWSSGAAVNVRGPKPGSSPALSSKPDKF